VRLASDLPPVERPHFEYRAPDNPRFAALIARAETPPAPMVAPGGVDVCAVPLEVRRAP
jgi:peptidylprolyl isomerase